MSDVSKVLQGLQKKWSTSEARERADKLPDGTYQAKVTSAGVSRSKAGRLQVFYYFKVVAGKMKGRSIGKFDGIETPENISWLKSTLKTLGVNVPKNILVLPKILEKLEDELAVIQVKTNGEFTNVYITKKIDKLDDGIDDDDTEDEEEVEDDEESDDSEELEEDEESDDEDDEEEETPKKKKKKVNEDDEE
jgi:hypothetical protein